MNPRIKLSGLKFLITTINEFLNVDIAIICNDVKLDLMTLFTACETKYFTQRMTFTTTSTIFTSINSVRGRNVWSTISNISRQSTGISYRIELFKYLDKEFSDFITYSERESKYFGMMERLTQGIFRYSLSWHLIY